MIDPIRRGKKFAPKKEEQASEVSKKREKEFYIDGRRDKKLSPKNRSACQVFIIVLIVAIIMTVIVFGGWLIYGLTQAKSQVITENYSGGAPVLKEEKSTDEEVKSEERVNILLLGNGGAGHSGGGLVDVIQVLSINPKTKKALTISIPRDLFVEVGRFGKHKINTMYVFGERDGKGRGGALSKQIAGEVLGIPIHYYFKVDFQGFREAVDVIGGIDVYVDKSIYDPLWGYSIKAGMHHFNGKEALDYVRSRKSTSDFDRSERQQKALLAMRDKAENLDLLRNPGKIAQIIEVLQENVRTDITPEEIYQIFNITKYIPRESLESYVIDNRKDNLLYSTMSKGGAYILLPVDKRGYEAIHQFIETKLP